MSFATRTMQGLEEWQYRTLEPATGTTVTLAATDPTFIFIRNDNKGGGYTVSVPSASASDGKLMCLSRDETAGYAWVTATQSGTSLGGLVNFPEGSWVKDGHKYYSVTNFSTNLLIGVYNATGQSLSFSTFGLHSVNLSYRKQSRINPNGLKYCIKSSSSGGSSTFLTVTVADNSTGTFTTTTPHDASRGWCFSTDGSKMYICGSSSYGGSNRSIAELESASGTSTGSYYGNSGSSEQYDCLIPIDQSTLAGWSVDLFGPDANKYKIKKLDLITNTATTFLTSSVTSALLDIDYGNGIIASSLYDAGAATSTVYLYNTSGSLLTSVSSGSIWEKVIIDPDASRIYIDDTTTNNLLIYRYRNGQLFLEETMDSNTSGTGTSLNPTSGLVDVWHGKQGVYSSWEKQRKIALSVSATGSSVHNVIHSQQVTDYTVTLSCQGSDKFNGNSATMDLPWAEDNVWIHSSLRNGSYIWQVISRKFGVTPTPNAGYFIGSPASGASRDEFKPRQLVSTDIPSLNYAPTNAPYVVAATSAALTNDRVLNNPSYGGVLIKDNGANSTIDLMMDDFKIYWWERPNPETGVTTRSIVGTLITHTNNGTLSVFSDDTGRYINHATATTLNAVGGLTDTVFTHIRTEWSPSFSAVMKTGANSTDIQNCRIWVGFFSASPTLSATPTAHYAAVRYDTAADGTAFFRFVTDNNSGTPEVTATDVAVTANTRYRFRIVSEDAGTTLKLFINDVLKATHSTKVPTATQGTAYFFTITNLSAGTARNIRFGGVSCRHN